MRRTLVLLTSGAFLVTAVLLIALVNHTMKQEALEEARHEGALLLERNLATHAYFTENLKPSVFALREEQTGHDFVAGDYFDPGWMSSTHALRVMNDYLEQRTELGYRYKDAAINARSPQNEADPVEREFLEEASRNPNLQDRSVVREDDGIPVLTVMRRGETMEAACLACHSEPENAPPSLVAEFGPDRSFGRQAGELVSVVSIQIPLEPAFAEANQLSLRLSLLMLALVAGLYLLQHLLTDRMLFAPLDAVREKAAAIVADESQLGERIPVPRGRELGELTQSFNEMSVALGEERKRMAERITERTRDLSRLASALQQADELVAIADAEGRLEYVNQAYEVGTGYASEEVIGRPAAELLPLGDCGDSFPLHSGIRAPTKGRGPLATSGKPLEVEFTVSSIVPGEVEEPGWIWVGRDMTQLRRIEEQLRHGQKLEAVGKLAGGIAHDFNNMLTAMAGYAEFLETQNLDDQGREDLSEIKKMVERASQLTRQLLTFSRHHVQAPIQLDLSEVISQMRDMLARMVGEDIRLQIDLEPGLPLIEADRGHLEQALMNLCVNARDAMPTGGTLLIRTGRGQPLRPDLPAYLDVDKTGGVSEEAGDRGAGNIPQETGTPDGANWVYLRVEDTGHGMAQSTQQRIFEPFFTTKEIGQGTGLGLAMVYGMVSQFGGSIEVESALGEGARFTVFFPASLGEGGLAAAFAEERAAVARGARIMLVEDQETIRNLVARVLQSAGHEVTGWSSAGEALSWFVEDPHRVDLAITDVIMPGTRGGALADKLQQIRPDLPLIFISGHPDATSAELELGSSRHFLQKPFQSHELLALLTQLLPSAPGSTTGGNPPPGEPHTLPPPRVPGAPLWGRLMVKLKRERSRTRGVRDGPNYQRMLRRLRRMLVDRGHSRQENPLLSPMRLPHAARGRALYG